MSPSTTLVDRTLVRFGHSPDPDDAFMFYALAEKKIRTGRYEFKDVVKDIESLNILSFRGELEATAVSVHAFAYVADRYSIMSCGASVGNQYGPIVVSKSVLSTKDLSDCLIAIPGELTTAFLVLKLCHPKIRYQVMPFDQILTAVGNATVDAGLIIHEGQLTYLKHGFHNVIDLGKWWCNETGLPLPLGVDVVRKNLGANVMRDITNIFKSSILYALAHRIDAAAYALRFGRGLDPKETDRFIQMYVNEETVSLSESTRKAISLLLKQGVQHGIIPKLPSVEFIDPL